MKRVLAFVAASIALGTAGGAMCDLAFPTAEPFQRPVLALLVPGCIIAFTGVIALIIAAAEMTAVLQDGAS